MNTIAASRYAGARATGILMIVLVVLGYATTLRHGAWPPSHPWSGISLLSLAAMHLLMPAPGAGVSSSRYLRFLYGVSLVVGVSGAVMWNVSAFIAIQ